ncbi:MAG: FKBP-type peptidyl-prolyl cis-trans isomerase [Microscillaceae bacterium]|nr:FKBP-type peptidyl-prolyl cis-trans isomerase [Microscillaceae bacterium]MDW8460426.1 FKBP-type peptidyl-prolyl cis-trans isomerase [Cytophagales bacterium]
MRIKSFLFDLWSILSCCLLAFSSLSAQDNIPADYRPLDISVNGKFYTIYLKVHNTTRPQNQLRQIMKNDFVTFHLVIKNYKDSVLRTTYPDKPIIKEVNTDEYTTSDKGFMEEMLTRIFLGDSATYLVKSDDLFEALRKKRPPFVPKGSLVKYIFKILKIQTYEEVELEKKERQFKLAQADDKIIAEYVAKNRIPAKRTYNGVWYVIDSVGTGDFARKSDIIEVNYTGKFLDGRVFVKRNNYDFPVGENFVLKGWEEFIVLLREGGKGMCILPSTLAHGEKGVEGLIPPNTPLIFEIEFLKIKKRKIVIEKKEGGELEKNKANMIPPHETKRMDYQKDENYRKLEKTYQMPKPKK